MSKVIFSIIFLAFFVALTANETFACSCFQPENTTIERQVKAAYTNSSAVFVGKVVEITEKSDAHSVIVKFKVEKSWNKKFLNEIVISTANDTAVCGYEFVVGKKYLVYANGENNKLTTNICTRTALVESSKDTAFLNKIRKPKVKSAPK